jgi:hypothetical protein
MNKRVARARFLGASLVGGTTLAVGCVVDAGTPPDGAADVTVAKTGSDDGASDAPAETGGDAADAGAGDA